MEMHEAMVGERLTLPVDPDAFPYRIMIGDDVGPAMPTKRRDGRGRVKASAWREVPPLPAGLYPLRVVDALGRHDHGQLRVVE